MDSWREFFEMGGYAGFVWPSYIAVTVVLIILTCLSLRSLRSAETDLESVEAKEQNRVDQPTSRPSDGDARP